MIGLSLRAACATAADTPNPPALNGIPNRAPSLGTMAE